MAVQSLQSLPAFPEPRPAAARNAAEPRESFELPEQDRDQAPARQTERAARDRAEPSETREAAPAPEAESSHPRDKADRSVKSDDVPKAAAAGRSQPAPQPAAPAVPAIAATPAPLDAGAVLSVLIAGEAAPAPVAKPDAGAVAEKTETNPAEQANGGQPAAPVTLPVIPVALPVAPLQLGASAPQPSAGEGDAVIQSATPAAAPPSPIVAAGLPTALPAAASPAKPDATGEGAVEGAPAKPAMPGFAAATAIAVDEPVGNPTETKPAAEFKLPEALQQIANPIELGATARPQQRLEPVPVTGAMAEHAQPQATSQQPSTPPTPVSSVPLEIGLRALSGAKRFEIRLDPAELGRVDVDLQISDSGEVTAKLVVDRVETLQLLQRDARTLERAFEQAGLKPSDGAVDITLRDPGEQSRQQQQRQDEARQGQRAFGHDRVSEAQQVPQPAAQPIRRMLRIGGVDVSV